MKNIRKSLFFFFCFSLGATANHYLTGNYRIIFEYLMWAGLIIALTVYIINKIKNQTKQEA